MAKVKYTILVSWHRKLNKQCCLAKTIVSKLHISDFSNILQQMCNTDNTLLHENVKYEWEKELGFLVYQISFTHLRQMFYCFNINHLQLKAAFCLRVYDKKTVLHGKENFKIPIGKMAGQENEKKAKITP